MKYLGAAFLSLLLCSSCDSERDTGPESTSPGDDGGGSDIPGAGNPDSESGELPVCGWGFDPDFEMEAYLCGGDGEDPMGTYPFECPPDLEVNGDCGAVTGYGCCDENGDLWYCAMGEDGADYLFKMPC